MDEDSQTKRTEPASRNDGQRSGRKRKRRRGKSKSSWSLDQFQVPEKEGLTRFHDLELPDRIMHAIADLGFQYCTPIQAKTLVHVHAGHNVSGRAQTGTGKTAAFALPLLQQLDMADKRVQALILAPTRELAGQVREKLMRVKDALAA